MRRVFFALWPDRTLVRQLTAISRELRPQSEGRLMRPETLHLTLAFIGNIPETQLAQLQTIAGALRAPSFELVLDRVDYVPGKRIVWASASNLPAALCDLVTQLNTGLAQAGFPVEARPFAPHVTLQRNARGALPEFSSPNIGWSVRDFVLVESLLQSASARYKVIGRWPLVPM